MKKHIALVISSLGTGGAERVISELANSWMDQGYAVSLITLASPEEAPFYPLSKKINLLQLNQSTSENAGWWVRLGNIWKRIFCLRKAFKHLNPNLIISFIDIMNITTLLAAKGLKVPVVVAEATDPHFHFVPFLYKKLRNITYKWAAVVVVLAGGAATYFSLALQSKIKIIPNIAKVPTEKKIYRSKVSRIISVGRLNLYKDFPTLIKAFAQITPKYPEIELVIYGEGRERNDLQSLIHSLNLDEKVHLPGVVQNVYKVLSAADVFILPSIYEGFGMVTVEAMSMGLPVVASNCSGTVDVVQDGVNGRLFPVGDVAALATLMTEIIEDPEQRAKLSKEALKITAQFSEQKILKLWEDVIKEVTEPSNEFVFQKES